MIIITRTNITDGELDHIREHVEASGLRTHVSRGAHRTIVGCIGDESILQVASLLSLPAVENVLPVMKPYRLAAREFVADRTLLRIGDRCGTTVGGTDLAIIAGPCAVEGPDMLHETARSVAAAGATMLRGGAFKPRSSPYSFQGLGEPGLRMLSEARAATGLPVVTEVVDTRQVELIAEYADVLQIGARNMQNFALLQEVGKTHRPVLLKRGMSGTISELLMAAEYILSQGNGDVILCERGIRTFETATRNTLDLGAVAFLKNETHLPVLVDPSHAAGRADLVAPLAFAAIAAGADGLIVEVHPRPEEALSDGNQSLTLAQFGELMSGVRAFAAAAGRTVSRAVEEEVA